MASDQSHPLSITEPAVQHLAEMIDQRPGPKPVDSCLRIVSALSGALKLAADQPKAGDEVFRFRGRVVVVAELPVAAQLRGMILDLQVNADGTKWLILLENPRR